MWYGKMVNGRDGFFLSLSGGGIGDDVFLRYTKDDIEYTLVESDGNTYTIRMNDFNGEYVWSAISRDADLIGYMTAEKYDGGKLKMELITKLIKCSGTSGKELMEEAEEKIAFLVEHIDYFFAPFGLTAEDLEFSHY